MSQSEVNPDCQTTRQNCHYPECDCPPLPEVEPRTYVCVTCGAVLTEGTVRMHNEWHDRLDRRMKGADSGLGFLSALTGPEGRL